MVDMSVKKYKYLVTVGCSQTYGQGLKLEDTWSNKLAEELNLIEIPLSACGAGWYYIHSMITTFIDKNKDKLDDCLFIIQHSTLERRLNYQEIPLVKSDYFKEFNIDFVPQVGHAALGYKNWENAIGHYHEDVIERAPDYMRDGRVQGQWIDIQNCNVYLGYFPEHKHYANSRHFWKLGPENDINPPHINEQLNELLLHWGSQLNATHLLMKSLDIDHIIVDGYTPILSYKLNFRNYYDTEEEFEWVKQFWSTDVSNEKDPDDVMVYDFKNINCGWVFDSIESKYKIDDVILWSLYQFKPHQSDWNIDGGHAGKVGMDLIKNVIKINLEEKGWI